MTAPDHQALAWIPTIRHTLAELEAAEREIVRRFKNHHGEQHEPGLVSVREAALKLLNKEQP